MTIILSWTDIVFRWPQGQPQQPQHLRRVQGELQAGPRWRACGCADQPILRRGQEPQQRCRWLQGVGFVCFNHDIRDTDLQ